MPHAVTGVRHKPGHTNFAIIYQHRPVILLNTTMWEAPHYSLVSPWSICNTDCLSEAIIIMQFVTTFVVFCHCLLVLVQVGKEIYQFYFNLKEFYSTKDMFPAINHAMANWVWGGFRAQLN